MNDFPQNPSAAAYLKFHITPRLIEEVLFHFNLPECCYGQGWLVWFLCLSAYSEIFKNIFVSLCKTYANRKPQLILIISKSVFYVFLSLWELSPCTSAGQTPSCPLSHPALNAGLWFTSPHFCVWPFHLKILVSGWRVGLAVWVRFFPTGKISAFVAIGPNLSADRIEGKVQPGLDAGRCYA